MQKCFGWYTSTKLTLSTRLDDEEGILVAGGVDSEGQPLKSVEFFSIPKQEWVSLADMTIARSGTTIQQTHGL